MTKKLVFACVVVIVFGFIHEHSVQNPPKPYTNEQIVNAIFQAEGGSKATYLYGIRSVNYDSPSEARQICLNTVRNQRVRHANHECDFTYLECLANRYCPIGAANDPKGLNKHWLGNVMYFLKESE